MVTIVKDWSVCGLIQTKKINTTTSCYWETSMLSVLNTFPCWKTHTFSKTLKTPSKKEGSYNILVLIYLGRKWLKGQAVLVLPIQEVNKRRPKHKHFRVSFYVVNEIWLHLTSYTFMSYVTVHWAITLYKKYIYA